MIWYYYIAIVAIVSQIFLLLNVYRNYRYAITHYAKQRTTYHPEIVLIIPCKGLDSAFEKNISSFFKQDSRNYSLWFVVEDKADLAYGQLCKLKERFAESSQAKDVQVLVAGKISQNPFDSVQGKRQICSQKIHNLLYCCSRISDDVEVLAFADSDICVRSDWLNQIVYPLRKSETGASSGYRWFVPEKNNLASLALSAVNAKVAQMLGNSHFNQAWGGSMAIRTEIFRNLGLAQIWTKTVSDDLSLSYAVKKSGKKVVFVPACLAASYESISLAKLMEFGRRQFLITRINAPKIWLIGLFGNLFSVLGLWLAAALAVFAAKTQNENFWLFAMVPVVFFVSQMARAVMRQAMIARLLKEDLPKMKFAMAADILFFPLWSLFMLFFIISSAFGRTIKWRNVRYKLISPTETIVLKG